MIQNISNKNQWTADENFVFRRKKDMLIMGQVLFLNKDLEGNIDVIDNYEEIPMTKALLLILYPEMRHEYKD